MPNVHQQWLSQPQCLAYLTLRWWHRSKTKPAIQLSSSQIHITWPTISRAKTTRDDASMRQIAESAASIRKRHCPWYLCMLPAENCNFTKTASRPLPARSAREFLKENTNAMTDISDLIDEALVWTSTWKEETGDMPRTIHSTRLDCTYCANSSSLSRSATPNCALVSECKECALCFLQQQVA